MTITRAIAVIFLVIAATYAVAQVSRPKLGYSDRLAPGGVVFEYQDKERQDIARHADIVVRASPTFAPGYVVGVAHEAGGWRLIGRGNLAKGPSPQAHLETSCSRSIAAGLGGKSVALWNKALAIREKNEDLGLDGETFTFYLKSRNAMGTTWSPGSHEPRMRRLAQIADDLFQACLDGKGLDTLGSRMNELSEML